MAEPKHMDVVALEDGRMGLVIATDEELRMVLVDAYRGDDCEVLRVPLANFLEVKDGSGSWFVGLRGALNSDGPLPDPPINDSASLEAAMRRARVD
jgi:hypothetical protein